MEHQPRPSQPSAEALASQTKPGVDDATANSDVSAFHVSDSEIVVLKQQRYFYLEKRGPFAQVAGPLWREFWSKAGHAFANVTPLPGMWGAGFVDPAVEGDEKHVYRAGVTLPEGTNLLDGIVTRGTLLGDTGVDCRYCKFVVSGSYDHMSKAWEECFARTATSGFLPRSTAWCFEEYLNTPMDTPNPADLRTAIYIPVDENDNFYQIEGPTVVELKHDTFVHLEGTGEFSSIAPALFGAFHGEHTAVLPMDIMTGMWAGSLVRDNGQNVYRPGATFNCSPSELLAKLKGGALLPGATLGCVGDGKSYARFDVTAPFSSLGAAFGACLDRVDASTTLQRREGVFSWETYLSDPAVTKPNENRIDIYIPVETKEPSTEV